MIPRDFILRYEPYTQRVQVLDNEQEIKKLSEDIQQQATLLDQSLTLFTK